MNNVRGTQVAAFAGRLPVVQFLLTLGEPAQAERTDQEGLSALHHASIGGKSDIVAEFMQVRETTARARGCSSRSEQSKTSPI